MFGRESSSSSSGSTGSGSGFRSLQAFLNQLDSENIKYRKDSEKAVVRITYDGKNFKDITFTFVFDDDGESVALRVFSIEQFTKAQLADAYEFCNQMNNKFRWLSFYVDKDDEFTAGTDAVITTANAGAVCSELLHRAVSIVDDACGLLHS